METDSNVFVVTWTIENFLFCTQKRGEYFLSPVFKMNEIDTVKWCLRLYPRGGGSSSSKKNSISFYLCKVKGCDGANSISTPIEFELSYLHADGRVEIELTRCEKEFSNEEFTWGLVDFRCRSKAIDELGQYPSKASFTVRCRLWKPNEDETVGGVSFLRTRIGIQRCAFIWVPGEFADDQLFEKKSIVVPFPTSENNPVTLISYVTHGPNCDEELTVEIKSTSLNSYVWYTIKVLNENESDEQSHEEEFWSNEKTSVTKFRPFLSRGQSSKKEFFSNRRVRLHCDLVLSKGVVYEGAEETYFDPDCLKKVCPLFKPGDKYGRETTDKNYTGTLKSDLQFFHKENTMCDTNLRTPTSVFPAHRAILCARSSVFRAMFEADMKEKNGDPVKIVDLDDNTVRCMLQFLYTDDVEELQEDGANKLYYAADKYRIMRLKEKCADFLGRNLTVSNVCQILTLADMHQDENLKNSSVDFILSSCKAVFKSEEWKTFVEENTRLAAHVMMVKCDKE